MLIRLAKHVAFRPNTLLLLQVGLQLLYLKSACDYSLVNVRMHMRAYGSCVHVGVSVLVHVLIVCAWPGMGSPWPSQPDGAMHVQRAYVLAQHINVYKAAACSLYAAVVSVSFVHRTFAVS